MKDFNETSWSYGENRVSFSNGFARLEGPIWGIDCSEKYKFKCTKAGIQIIVNQSNLKSFDLIIHDDNRLIVKPSISPFF